MQADRELLELAAKAAGMEVRAFTNGLLCFWHQRGPQDAVTWNPATDDGDGARLEAALTIDVLWCDGYVRACALGDEFGEGFIEFADYADHDGDKQAARRMATLRCAAAIGRAGGSAGEGG